MNRKTKTKKPGDQKDEVEELLRAAQDDMLLKLSLDSHISHGGGVSLGDADIDRRFHALKLKTASSGGPAAAVASKAPNASKAKLKSDQVVVVVDEGLKAVLGDDLSARFAALKASLPTTSSSSSSSSSTTITTADVTTSYEEEDDDEDEVEKLIRWAKDAARLDPSPPSDDDDDQDTSDQDDDDHRVDTRRKGNRSTKS